MDAPPPVRATPCYWLPEHIYTCATPDGVIFLDTRRNRYRGLGPREAESLRPFVHDWPGGFTSHAGMDALDQDAVGELLATLISARLISVKPVPSPRASRAEVALGRPLQAIGVGTEFDYPVATATLLAFLGAYAGALLDIRLRSLCTVVLRIRSRKLQCPPRSPDADIEKIKSLVSSFRRIRHHFFTGNGKCLLHALTLTRYLALYEVFPTLVIGVRTSPWGAHSWVEHNGYTLDATPEKVRTFTPILAV